MLLRRQWSCDQSVQKGGTTKPTGQRAYTIEEQAADMKSKRATSQPVITISRAEYDRQREMSTVRWKEIVSSGTQINVPEAVVNNAWRNLIVQQYQIRANDQMNYSAGNQYARQSANGIGGCDWSMMLYRHFDS